MNDTKQPEALRLAAALEGGTYLLSVERDSTATELRRLHAENALLHYTLTAYTGVSEALAVEQALAAMKNITDFDGLSSAKQALSAVLDHPQNHVPDAGNMVPAGWKLVPVEPTDDMLYDIQEFSHILPPRGKRIWAHMLNAAPQPPTVKDSLTVEQPQANQPAMTPIAQRKLDSLLAEGYTISGYSIYHEQKHQLGFVTGAGLVGWWRPDGMEYPQPQGEQEPVGFVRQIDIEQIAKTPSDWGAMSGRVMGFNTVPVYTHPQPKRETQFDAISVDQERLAEQFCAEIAGPRGGKPSLPDPVRLLEMAEALYRAEAHQNGAIERAHRIGGEA